MQYIVTGLEYRNTTITHYFFSTNTHCFQQLLIVFQQILIVFFQKLPIRLPYYQDMNAEARYNGTVEMQLWYLTGSLLPDKTLPETGEASRYPVARDPVFREQS